MELFGRHAGMKETMAALDTLRSLEHGVAGA
jgi:hypothetical protein